MSGLAEKLRGRGVALREQIAVTGLRRNGAGWAIDTRDGAARPSPSS